MGIIIIFIPFLERVVEKGLSLNFYVPNGIHLSFLDSRTARLMKRAGFREVRIGLESASSEFHTLNDGKLDIDTFPDGISILKEAGFKGSEIGVYLLAGLPGQRWQEVEDSIRYVSEYRVRIHVAKFSPVPGTSMFERSVELSKFPVGEEPLTHNNSIFPMQWRGFTVEDMERLKRLSKELSCNY